MEVFEGGSRPPAPLRHSSPDGNEYVEGESEKYLVQPLSPGGGMGMAPGGPYYDDPPNTRTKVHNAYDNRQPMITDNRQSMIADNRQPKYENENRQQAKYDARSELMMPTTDNIYGMLTKGSKMDHVTRHMTPSAYETKVSKAEIEAKDKLDELHQAQFVEKLQKEEMGEALSDLKEVTQNGLKTMFADAVGKQNNFINSVSNYNPVIPRSFPAPQMNEFVGGGGPMGGEPDRRYGNVMTNSLPGPEDEMGEREYNPDVPMFNPMGPGPMGPME